MTDYFRALCAELVDVATAHCHPDDDAVGYCAAVLARARAALAQPEPERPTDEELCQILHQAVCDFPPTHPDALNLDVRQYEIALQLRKARAVLDRWGQDQQNKEAIND
jgi:hypothetical protein